MTLPCNVPAWERSLRALLGVALLTAAALVPFVGWGLWLGVAAGATLALTGLVGFCPACAMAGRR